MDRPRRGEPSARAAQLLTILACTAFTVAVVAALDPTSLVVARPGLRILIETVGFFLPLFAAVALLLPDGPLEPSRWAFVAALTLLGVTNGLAAVVAATGVYETVTHESVVVYPWIWSRIGAGVLFVHGASQDGRRTRRTIGIVVTAVLVLDLVVVATRPAWPDVVVLVESGTAVRLDILRPGLWWLLQAVTGLLFAVGAVRSGRTRREGGPDILSFVSLALVVQAFAHLHEILFPSLLTPVVSTADTLRMASFAVLAVGGAIELRRLLRERAEAIRLHRDQLEERRRQQAATQRLLETERNFTAVVTHELQTPIATIRAFTHALTRLTPGDAAAVREAIAGIDTESRRVAELISRIGEFRDFDGTGLVCEPRPVRLRTLLDEAARVVASLPGDHPVSVEGPDLRVLADPVRFGQALRNVVVNAARYSPAGTPIELVTVGHADRVEVVITDHGPGIPVGERRRVVERFARGDQAAAVPGSGLGLTIVDLVMAAHGGSLEITDPNNGRPSGTRVVLTLPATMVLPAIG